MAAGQDARPFRWHYDELDDKNFQLHGRTLLLFLLLLLAAFLFFLLLCLYVRWSCRHRPSPTGLEGGGVGGDGGLEAVAVKRLPMTVRRGGEAACSICLSVVTVGEKERVLPGCGHGFHPECIDEWLQKRSSCPLCRARIGGSGEEKEDPPEEV
ncbi:hypothetical protein HPP92_023460 [Vanilla planifolia]|uniref:RING-type domain-containing protein n=1 Tax=Vanilla planifolia TaxID=51239 RepID=A0A835Q2N7_VANPL|nr:hypothetical protein HPP92_023460 [Vanilla planifolia]